MLCCIYELYKDKGFVYSYELSMLLGMDYKTVQRLMSEMAANSLIIRLDGRIRLEGTKTAVSGWVITEYAKSIIRDIQSSWLRLTLDIRLGRDISLQRIKAAS